MLEGAVLMGVEQRYMGTQAMAELMSKARLRGLRVGLGLNPDRKASVASLDEPAASLVLHIGTRPVMVKPLIVEYVNDDLAAACGRAQRLLDEVAA